MSQENVELAARFYGVATTKAGILAGLPWTMDLCHPEIEWIASEDGATHRGREGVRQRLEEWLESFDDYRWEVQRMTDCGSGEVLVEATEVGRGAMSGAEVRTTGYELLTIRDGMIVRIREYYEKAAALEAAGLRE